MNKKALFLTFQPVSACDGVSKKVFAQRDGIIKNGYSCDIVYPILKNNHLLCFYLNDKVLIDDVKRCYVNFSRSFYAFLFDVIQNNSYNFIYIRYCLNASLEFNSFLVSCKRKCTAVFLEIATFPYDQEIYSLRRLPFLLKERYYRSCWKGKIDKIITYTSFNKIYGIDTIRIANATPFIPKMKKDSYPRDNIRCIMVANIAYWHGIDRFIKGLYNYYLSSPCMNVEFAIVGGGDVSLIKEYQEMVERLGLMKHVVFYGPKEGNELDILFDDADIAIGCLACHRKGIHTIRALKSVEYAMRGIPFVYSENNPDFDEMEYVFHVPANESPIDIKSIVSFYQRKTYKPCDIRTTALEFTWERQMGIVLSEI